MTFYKFDPPLFNLDLSTAQLTNKPHCIYNTQVDDSMEPSTHTAHLNKQYCVNMFYVMFPLRQSFPVEGNRVFSKGSTVLKLCPARVIG